MTDIYIRRDASFRRPLVMALAVVGAVLLVVGAWNLFGRRSTSVPTGEDPVPGLIPPESPSDAGQAAPSPPPETPDKVTVAPSNPANSTAPVTQLTEAKSLRDQNRLLEARDKAFQLLEQEQDPRLRQATEQLLGQLHTSLVLTPHDMPEKESYTIQRGDSLDRLARKFGTTVELLRKGNGISGSNIRYGDLLRIFTGTFAVTVSKSRNDLVVTCNSRFFKRYRVGTGQYGRTPTGQFVIKDKIVHPPWWKPDGKMIAYGDPDNELGTHWMSLESKDNPQLRGYGIHGTWEPDTIGQQASAGCVRLLNEEVEELFTLLPRGTVVVIVE